MLFRINIVDCLYLSPLFSPIFPCTTHFKPDPAYRGFRLSLVVNEAWDLYQNEVGQVGRKNGKLDARRRFRGEDKNGIAPGGILPLPARFVCQELLRIGASDSFENSGDPNEDDRAAKRHDNRANQPSGRPDSQTPEKPTTKP